MRFEELNVGRTVRTRRRQILKSDVVAFIGMVGMFEQVFLADRVPDSGGDPVRLVPGMVVLGVAEGLLCVEGWLEHGIAHLGFSTVEFSGPVYADDEVWAEVEVTKARLSRTRPNVGVVGFRHVVRSNRQETVAQYESTRMVSA